MKVKCVSEAVPPQLQDAVSVGPHFEGRRTFGVVLGEVYAVFGIEVFKGIPWVQVEVARDEIIPAPLALFSIVDPAIPDLWEARLDGADRLVMWPAAFFTPGFHELVYNGDPHATAALERIRQMLSE